MTHNDPGQFSSAVAEILSVNKVGAKKSHPLLEIYKVGYKRRIEKERGDVRMAECSGKSRDRFLDRCSNLKETDWTSAFLPKLKSIISKLKLEPMKSSTGYRC